MSIKINSTPSVKPLPEVNSLQKTNRSHKGRSVKRVPAPGGVSALSKTRRQTDKATSIYISSRELKASEFDIIQRLISENKWQAIETAFANYAPDLGAFKHLLNKMSETKGIPKELYPSISSHFCNCFVQEKAPLIADADLDNDMEKNDFVRFEIIGKILDNDPLAPDSAIKTVARTAVEVFLDDAPDIGVEKIDLEKQAALKMRDYLVECKDKLDEELTAQIQ